MDGAAEGAGFQFLLGNSAHTAGGIDLCTTTPPGTMIIMEECEAALFD